MSEGFGGGGALSRRVAPFACVVSPYHLTTREPAAMVTLQLAERVTTLLLAPLSARAGSRVEMASVMAEARRSPVYVEYMSSWEWAETLFREGVIGSVSGGEDPVDDVRAVCARLAWDPSLGALSRFMRPGLFDDDRAYLRAASADVLKAGPDPGVALPIAAGLDVFASERGLVVARSGAVSVAQKAESRLGRELFRVVVPALVQASAERVLLLRALLDDERAGLARAVSLAFETGDVGGVRAAAGEYAGAFERERGEICAAPEPGDADEVRVVVGEVSVVGMALPVDAVLRSGVAAAGGGLTDGDLGVVRTIVISAIGRR